VFIVILIITIPPPPTWSPSLYTREALRDVQEAVPYNNSKNTQEKREGTEPLPYNIQAIK